MDFLHNRKQNEKIRETTLLLTAVKTHEDLLALVKKICIGRHKIQYNHIIAYISGGVFALISAGFIFTYMRGSADTPPPWLLWVSVAITLAIFILIHTRHTRLDKLSKAITLRALSLQYGFATNVNLPASLKAFADLSRGNYSREIDTQTQGTYQGALHDLPYYFCHLHYVDKNRNGRNEIDEYTHSDRYYLFIQFPWVKGISLRSDSQREIDLKIKSKTASQAFNRAYTLTGLSDMLCARFAKPLTVLHMLKFKSLLTRPNFTFSADGWLCIGFDNKDVFASGIQATLKDPQAFYKLIQNDIAMPKMLGVLDFVHQLAQQHDDNFDSRESV